MSYKLSYRKRQFFKCKNLYILYGNYCKITYMLIFLKFKREFLSICAIGQPLPVIIFEIINSVKVKALKILFKICVVSSILTLELTLFCKSRNINQAVGNASMVY